MVPNLNSVVSKPLHPLAQKRVLNLSAEFVSALLIQAKTLAFKRGDEVVLRNHVDEALRTIRAENSSNWKAEWAAIIGGAFFGAFVQGFIDALEKPSRNTLIAYTVLGFVGMLMIFIGLRKR